MSLDNPSSFLSATREGGQRPSAQAALGRTLRRFALMVASVAAATGGAQLQAQTPGASWVDVRPHEPVVSMAIRFPAGADQDPAGKEGAAFLLGRILEAEANRRLQVLGGRAEFRVERGGFLARVTLPPAHWEQGWVEVSTLLSAASVTQPQVIRERESQRTRLRFQEGAPSRTFEALWFAFRFRGVEASRVTTGDPIEGTMATLEGLTADDLLRFRGDALRWTDARAGIVGPVDPEEVRRVLRGPVEVLGSAVVERVDEASALTGGIATDVASDVAVTGAATGALAAQGIVEGEEGEVGLEPFGSGPRRVNPSIPPFLMTEGMRTSPRLWSLGQREIHDEDLTSTWIGIAWALPASTPWVLMDFMAHLIGESLNTTPPEPGLFRADVRIEMEGDRPTLVVLATVDPQATFRWEARILSAVAAMAEDPPQGAFFELARRRYRSARLMDQELPAQRAIWITERGAREGSVPSVRSEVWGLSREGLSALASARGEPRILLYGPRTMMGTEFSRQSP
jgi:hypothetical protein